MPQDRIPVGSIHLFHGDKGGVGKSLAAEAFADYLLEKKSLKPIIIDADPRNPDVSRMFSDTSATIHQINLRLKDGWLELIDVLNEAHAATPIIISLPAGIGDFTRSYSALFHEGLHQIGRKVTLFWVINRDKDSVNLLRLALQDFKDVVEASVVVKNLYWSGGDPSKFVRWQDSQTRKDFIENGGLEIELPELHDRVTDTIFNSTEHNGKSPFRKIMMAPTLRLSDRIELTRWIKDIDATFDALLQEGA